jgi:hypothetical protein
MAEMVMLLISGYSPEIGVQMYCAKGEKSQGYTSYSQDGRK